MTEQEFHMKIYALEAQVRQLQEQLFERSTLVMDLAMERIFRALVHVPTFDERMCQIADIHYPSDTFVVLIVRPFSRHGGAEQNLSFDADRSICDYIGGMLISELQNALKPIAKCYSANLHDSVNLLLCLNYSPQPLETRYEAVYERSKQCLARVSRDLDAHFQGSISPAFIGAENISAQYQNTYDLNIYAQSNRISELNLITLADAKRIISQHSINTSALLNFYTKMNLWRFGEAKVCLREAMDSFLLRTIGGNRTLQTFVLTHLNNAFKSMLPPVPLGEQTRILDAVRAVYRVKRRSHLYEQPEDMEKLLDYVFAFVEETLSPLQKNVPDQMRFVSDEILRNYSDPGLSISALAEQLEIPQATLSNQFKRWSGMTPVQHLQQTRIDAAKQYMDDPTLSISEIARRVGYYSDSAFIHVFKRLTGMTPGVFRTSHEKPKNFVLDPEQEDSEEIYVF